MQHAILNKFCIYGPLITTHHSLIAKYYELTQKRSATNRVLQEMANRFWTNRCAKRSVSLYAAWKLLSYVMSMITLMFVLDVSLPCHINSQVRP